MVSPASLHDDDMSDVSMSPETEDEDSDTESGNGTSSTTTTAQAILPPVNNAPSDTSRKRKMSSEIQSVGLEDAEGIKRTKLEVPQDLTLESIRTAGGRLPVDKSLLPAEIWHHIFTFTPPRALGRLLRVNKRFSAYLDPSSKAIPSLLASLSPSAVKPCQPDLIWQASRRLFHPWMPSPLEGMSELDMWRLACNSACQFCGKIGHPSFPADQWHGGPGENGVRPVWGFGIRTCGSCLQQKTIKEIDLLLSSSVPSPLIPALPFILLTPELHVIASIALQNGPPPPQIQYAKQFYKPHVEDIKLEFFKVKAMGSGTAEEWLKGLDNRGKDVRNDVARWERFEHIGALQRMRNQEMAEKQEVILKAKPQPQLNAPAQPTIPRPTQLNGLSQIPIVSNNISSANNFNTQPSPSVQQYPQLPQRFDSPAQAGFSMYPRPFQQPQRHERTKEEVTELKAARRAEIERRCLLLDPPLIPNVLAHMTSFQAALQIIKPFDDNAWEMLQPRLLSQRAEAQQREDDRIAQNRVVQEKSDERRQDIQVKDSKDLVERDWDDAQLIVRNRIGPYADEIIRDGWAGGRRINKDNCPDFAAEVLTYVRKRFYAEIAKDDMAAQAAGQQIPMDPPNGPWTRKLTLENMRWVYDTKIKPLTEPYRKEIFLCNGCENSKFYAFEGVCQHYASKHTTSLSSGSIVVHWRAEWPETPPFNPDPSVAKTVFLNGTTSGAPFPNETTATSPAFGYGGYQAFSGAPPATTHIAQPALYPPTSGAYYGPPQYSEQYPGQQAGPYGHPVPVQPQSQGYQPSQYQGSQVNGYQSYQGYPQQSFDVPYTPAVPVAYNSPPISQPYPVSLPEKPSHPQTQVPVVHTVGSQSHIPPVTFKTEAYKTQVQDMALKARELWNSTAGVKDMPGSVRVYVILHHILQHFRARYNEDPALTMVIDGLQNYKDMRPVRNINGLACKTCTLERARKPVNPHTVSSKSSGADRKLFSFPQLLNHFQSTHVGHASPGDWNEDEQTPEVDWTQDMVELPDKSKIASLPSAHGMDEYKVQLLKEALPDAFRLSPPKVEDKEPEQSFLSYPEAVQQDPNQLAPSRDNHERYYTSTSQGQVADSDPYPLYHARDHELQNRSPAIFAASERPQSRQNSNVYRDQRPVRYVEHRPASPAPYVQPQEGRVRYIIRDDDRSYSRNPENSEPNEVRGRSRMSPRHEPPRTEYYYPQADSLPRLIEMAGRLAKAAPELGNPDSYPSYASDSQHRTEPSSRPISLGGQHGRSQQASRPDAVDAGSEDGELRAHMVGSQQVKQNASSAEARLAAEQFLSQMVPKENTKDSIIKMEESERRDEVAERPRWEPERVEASRQVYRPPQDAQIESRYYSNGNDFSAATVRPVQSDSPRPQSSRAIPDRVPSRQHQTIPYEYDERYAAPVRQVYSNHIRSPEVVEHRYLQNDIVYHDERGVVQAAHPRPGRYATYDGLRTENERPRSRSPVYVVDPNQYRTRSPIRRYAPQDAIYQTRPSQAPVEEVAYERIPRPEYYRVYPDEQHRPRQPQYETQVEYVQVAPDGDYVIRRPVRREQEPVYSYEEAPMSRQPIYESRAPLSRSDPAYYEEYDPRHPEPLPETAIRQVRYQ